jgi:hypothetical protein
MNKARNLVEMGEFYASTVLTEAAKKNNLKGIAKDTFAIAGKKTSDVVLPKGLKTKAYDKRGPLSNENEKSLTKPLEKKDAKGKPTFTGVEKFSESPEKKEVETINNFMNKSIFDRLYEDVMSDNINSPEDTDLHDAHALDLPGTEEHGDNEVTITLSKELASKLHDALMAVLGSSEEQHAEDESEDEGEEDAEEAHVDGCKCDDCLHSEDEENTLPEATELKELPSSVAKVTKVGGKADVVGDETSKLVDGKGGDGKIKDGIDAEGEDEGHALVNAKKGHPTPVTGKSNVVNSKASKVGAYVAGLK